MSNIYDNWERLVEVVLRREQLRQLALISSSEPSSCSVSPSLNTPIHDDRSVQLGSSSSPVNETDWERLLPLDYEDIISRSVNPVAYATKEDLYTSLCSSPILLDGGKMSFHIDKTTGKKCYMIGAMALNGGLYKYHRKSISHADSRFSMVAVLSNSWDPNFRGQIETQMLSSKTRYAAYLVYRFGKYYKHLPPAKGIIKFVNLDEDRDAERRATTIQFRPVTRPDGWMEVQLGMFYNDLGFDGPVEARLSGPSVHLFISLFIEGIEFRPAANAAMESVSKENLPSHLLSLMDVCNEKNKELLRRNLQSFHIDKTTGKKCYMIGAMELIMGLFYNYWKLAPHAASRFSMVAELRDIWGLDIRGKIETQMLSPKTRYAAFLVYRLEKYSKDIPPAKGIIKFVNLDEDDDAERRATTIQLRPELVGKGQQIAVSRPDGWMEVQLGMFYNNLGYDGPVEARLFKFSLRLNIVIVVEGIEFRPTTNVDIEFGSKENVENRRKGIFSKLKISK